MGWQIKDTVIIKAVHVSVFCCILVDEKFIWDRTDYLKLVRLKDLDLISDVNNNKK